MNRFAGLVIGAAFLAVSGCGIKPVGDTGPEGSVTWNVLDLQYIGGNHVSVIGSPEIVDIRRWRGGAFDGTMDGLIVTTNPLVGAAKFTIEAIFRPDLGGNGEQCLLNIRERVGDNQTLLEIRLDDDRWSLWSAVKSGDSDHTLSGEEATYPLGVWYHVALVSDGSSMRQYVEGKEDRSGPLKAPALGEGRTAIAMRMTEAYWFKGVIRTIRFTPKALRPKEFLRE